MPHVISQKNSVTALRLECEAIKRVRNDMGLTNVEIMIPFVRTLEEGRKVIELLEEQGLKTR